MFDFGVLKILVTFGIVISFLLWQILSVSTDDD